MCLASAARCTASRGSGRAEGGDAGDIFRAGAKPPLLPTAADQRIGKMNIVACAHQRADALRAADLVGRERQQIGAQHGDIAIDAARRLHGIDMEQTARRMHDRRGLRDRLNDAGFVIGEHQRNQRPRRFGNGFGAAPPDRAAPAHRPAIPRSPRAGNRPPARTEACSTAESKSRERGRLSPAISIAGVSASMLASVPLEVKNTSPGARPDQRRNLFARVLDQTPRGAALGMHRGRIAGHRKRLGNRPPAPHPAAAPWRSNRNSCARPCWLCLLFWPPACARSRDPMLSRPRPSTSPVAKK